MYLKRGPFFFTVFCSGGFCSAFDPIMLAVFPVGTFIHSASSIGCIQVVGEFTLSSPSISISISNSACGILAPMPVVSVISVISVTFDLSVPSASIPSWVARASGPIDERSSCSPTGMQAPASVFLVPSSKSMDERLSQEGISGGNPSTLQETATPNQSTQSCVVAFVHSLVDSVSIRSCSAAQLGWIIIHRTALVARATARQSETLRTANK
mmetsp:Transcript_14720/g.41987  ORF Transcript_14720/g.41987 Transcript_14720/m.41987 type:complete len:212 (+) Transcript_14720:308-943(+)